MGDLVRLLPSWREFGQAGKLRGGVLGDLFGGLRLSLSGWLNDALATVKALRLEQVVEGDAIGLMGRLVKLVWTMMSSMSQTTSSGGFSRDSRYQQKLLVGAFQVGVLALVFPGEIADFATSAEPWPPVFLSAPISKAKRTSRSGSASGGVWRPSSGRGH